MHDFHTLIGLIRMANSNLVKAERMLLARPSNKSANEYAIEHETEELSNATLEVVAATSKYLTTCKRIRDELFLTNLKL